MPSLKPAFDHVSGCSMILLMLWAIAILDDAESAETDRLRRIDRHRKLELLRKGVTPRPF
jgi:hypothetical protein